MRLTSRSIRVVVIDDNPDIVSMVVDVLSRADRVEVLRTAFDPDEGERIVSELKPDVAIVDVSMPNGGGVRATKLIKAASPDTAVLIFSGANDSNAVIEMLRQGAIGHVAKAAPIENLIEAVAASARGLMILSEDVTSSVRRELAKGGQLDTATHLDESASVERMLAERGFKAVFQPIVELATRRPRGYEALMRFRTGAPDDWFAKAWRVGRGPELELYAIELAVAALDRIPPNLYLSVNLSPDTLLHRGLRELLRGCDPARIVLEITEHATIDNIDSFQTALGNVRDCGVRVAVDDAGAGFANFVRLLQLVPEVIKLDRVLVADIHRDRVKAAIAESMITLATGIGAQLAGEGVETEPEALKLLELGVRFGQGYLFGRPESLPPDVVDVHAVD